MRLETALKIQCNKHVNTYKRLITGTEPTVAGSARSRDVTSAKQAVNVGMHARCRNGRHVEDAGLDK